MKGYREEGKKQHITAFYMETLALALIFIAVILVLTKVFAVSGQMSDKARFLTKAVHLAENAAEAFSASHSPEALADLLEENGNAMFLEEDGNPMLRVSYDEEMQPTPNGNFLVDVVWVPEDGVEKGLVQGVITVHRSDTGEEIYRLKTAVYTGQ